MGEKEAEKTLQGSQDGGYAPCAAREGNDHGYCGPRARSLGKGRTRFRSLTRLDLARRRYCRVDLLCRWTSRGQRLADAIEPRVLRGIEGRGSRAERRIDGQAARLALNYDVMIISLDFSLDYCTVGEFFCVPRILPGVQWGWSVVVVLRFGDVPAPANEGVSRLEAHLTSPEDLDFEQQCVSHCFAHRLHNPPSVPVNADPVRPRPRRFLDSTSTPAHPKILQIPAFDRPPRPLQTKPHDVSAALFSGPPGPRVEYPPPPRTRRC